MHWFYNLYYRDKHFNMCDYACAWTNKGNHLMSFCFITEMIQEVKQSPHNHWELSSHQYCNRCIACPVDNLCLTVYSFKVALSIIAVVFPQGWRVSDRPAIRNKPKGSVKRWSSLNEWKDSHFRKRILQC